MDIQTFIGNIGEFINNTIIPLLFSLALLVFIFNVFQFYIVGGADPEKQAKAKSLALYGIIAFVLLVSIWGIVNLLVSGFAFGPNTPIQSDYVERG